MIFDENLDFSTILDDALAKSQKTKKRVLIEFGGDWCIWSHRMNSVVESKKFKSLIDDNFIFLRCTINALGECNYPSDREYPEFSSIPHFILLDENGKIIASQDTPGFEFLWFYKKWSLYNFFKKWAKL